MSYGGSGGGSGSIHASSDVALNNPADGQALTYSTNLQKWQNQIVAVTAENVVFITGLTPSSVSSNLATAQSNRSTLDAIVAANPGKSFVIPAGTYPMCSGANINASLHGAGERLTFLEQWEQSGTTQNFMFKCVGSFAASTSVASSVPWGAGSVTTSSSVTLAQGSWLVLSSAEILTVESGKTFTKGEALRVTSAVAGGTTISFDQTINDRYSAASNAIITPVNTLSNASFGDMTIKNMQTGTTHVTGFFQFLAAERCNVQNVTLVGYNTSAIQIKTSFDCAVRNATLMDGVVDTPGLGYGVEVQASSRNIKVADSLVRGGRHAMTTNSTQATGYPGQPLDVAFQNCLSEASLSTAFDTHSSGRNIIIDNCHASHAENAAFSIRTSSTKFTNCSVDYAKIGLNLGLIADTAYPSGVTIRNFTARHIMRSSSDATSRNGVGIQVDGNSNTNITLEGLHFDSIDRYGILFNGPVDNFKLRHSTFQDMHINPATSNGTDVQAAMYVPSSMTMTGFDLDDVEAYNTMASTTEPGIGGGQMASLLNVASTSVSGLLRNVKGQALTGNLIITASTSLIQSSYMGSANNLSDVASTATALSNLGGAPLSIAGGYASGYYYHANSPGTSATSAALGVNGLRLTPWFVPRPITITRIGADVSMVGDSGSKIRLGIYADTGSGVPGTLMLDAGQIAGDSATVQEIVVSQALNAGLYWIGAVVQAVTTTQPTLVTVSSGNQSAPIALGATIPGSAQTSKGYLQSSVSGALPAMFTATLVSSGDFPRLFVKIG